LNGTSTSHPSTSTSIQVYQVLQHCATILKAEITQPYWVIQHKLWKQPVAWPMTRPRWLDILVLGQVGRTTLQAVLYDRNPFNNPLNARRQCMSPWRSPSRLSSLSVTYVKGRVERKLQHMEGTKNVSVFLLFCNFLFCSVNKYVCDTVKYVLFSFHVKTHQNALSSLGLGRAYRYLGLIARWEEGPERRGGRGKTRWRDVGKDEGRKQTEQERRCKNQPHNCISYGHRLPG